MCCAIGALLIAMIATARRGLKAVSGCRLYARWAAGFAAALVLGASSAIAAQHLGHYAKRAEVNESSVLAEMLAQPICSGIVSTRNGTQFVQLD